MAHALARASEAGVSREQLQALLRQRADRSGAHRASDRGAAQEHDRPRDGDRRSCSPSATASRSRPRRWRANEEALRRAVLTLWQTNLLRGTRLAVLDEVANGISYYDYTFLRELPRFYAALEDLLRRARSGLERHGAALVPAHGQLDRRRPRRQSLRHGRGAAPDPAAAEQPRARASISTSCISSAASCRSTGAWSGVSDEPRALAERFARPLAASPRRALSARHLRHLRAARGDRLAARPAAKRRTTPWARRRPTRDAAGLQGRPRRRCIARWRPTARPALARGRLRSLRRAVDVFGFHLAGVDLRQNSDVHERTVAELLEAAAPGNGYLRLAEAERAALLLAELATARPLTSPFVAYSDETARELAILQAAAEAHRRYGTAAVPNYVISKADSASRRAGGGAAAQGGGAAAPARAARSTSTSCRCSRPSTICAAAAASWTSCLRLPQYARLLDEPRPTCRR